MNSRHQKRSNNVWRRRKCTACGAIFTTIEQPDLTGALLVKHPAHLQPFSRDILFLSLYDSLRHRKTAIHDASGLYDTVLAQLYPHIADGILERDIIVTVTAAILERFDKAAAVSYAAFHKA